MKTTTINGANYYYQEPKYNDVDNRVTGRHLYHNYTFELPKSKIELMASQGIISIEQLARDKMLQQDPTIFDTNFYGNYKKGVWALLRKQIQTTLFWALNKQPASFTMYVDKIDDTITNQVKMLIQNGTRANICVPSTGYTCSIPAVVNKKQMILFTKEFMCETYWEQYTQGTLQDNDVLKHINELTVKVSHLQDYRNHVQNEIWKQVNYAIQPHQDDWKCQNIYTMNARIQFAINAQTSEILSKYAYDFKLSPEQAITLEDVLDPKFYDHMIEQLSSYSRAFGINVKTTESSSEVDSYMPVNWMRNKLSESAQLKQAFRKQQALAKAPLNELVQAYLQLDWYMGQPDFTPYLVEGYSLCDSCGHVINQHDEYCPKCNDLNGLYVPDSLSYDTTQDCVRRNWIEDLV